MDALKRRGLRRQEKGETAARRATKKGMVAFYARFPLPSILLLLRTSPANRPSLGSTIVCCVCEWWVHTGGAAGLVVLRPRPLSRLRKGRSENVKERAVTCSSVPVVCRGGSPHNAHLLPRCAQEGARTCDYTLNPSLYTCPAGACALRLTHAGTHTKKACRSPCAVARLARSPLSSSSSLPHTRHLSHLPARDCTDRHCPATPGT
jgi:hypothetical protein